MPDKLGRVAIYCGASILPLMFLIGQIAERVLKHYNPAHVNVHHELAYLRPIMLSSIISGLGMLVLSILLVLLARSQNADSSNYKVAAVIILLQITTVIFAALIALVFPIAQ